MSEKSKVEQVQEAILASVGDALDKIDEETLSEALKEGLSIWNLALKIGLFYGENFKKISDQFELIKTDTHTQTVIHECMKHAGTHLCMAHEIMLRNDKGGMVMFGHVADPKPIIHYQTSLEQSYSRLIEAEAHLNLARDLHKESLKPKEEFKKEE